MVLTYLKASLLGLLLLVPSLSRGCNLDCQRDERRASLSQVELIDTLHDITRLISFKFSEKSFESTYYDGDGLQTRMHPAYDGFAWLVDLGPAPYAKVIDIRRVINAKIREKDYQIERDTLYDFKLGREIRIRSDLDMYLEYPEIFDAAGKSTIILSGPFWQFAETGEKAIGLLKLPGDGLELIQPYDKYFSGHHVLCLNNINKTFPGRSVRLIPPIHPAEKMTPNEIKERFTIQVEKGCESAIQVGPAFFEPQQNPNVGTNRVGISGSSLNKATRSILFQLISRENGDEKNMIFLSQSSISSFDAMVLLEAVADQLLGKNSINWAVGLQDDYLRSGPVVVDNSGTMELTPTDIPVGALLIFEKTLH